MSSKTGNKSKSKKCIKTTLGTSKPCNINENIVDDSHVRGPIHTSIFGLREVLSLFTTATDEVQRYVAHECDIMYECRICRTIFRSLANFILHKRKFCTAKYDLTNELKQNAGCEEDIITHEDSSKSSPDSKSEESISSNRKRTKAAKRKLSIVLNKLVDQHESEKITKDCLNDENSNDFPMYNQNVDNKDIRLEQIEGSQAGIFQTISTNNQETEFMKSEVMEIHGILENNEAILGPDGKILQFETEKMKENKLIPKGNLICVVCNQKFATKKTLTYHIKYKHNETRLIYPCPECRDTFANVWCVFRHLYKIHRKTTVQIRKLRTQIHNSAIKQSQKPLPKQDTLQLQDILRNKHNEHQVNQQWLANFEGDNDLQMCGGCGKRFERKAALHSHSQMCMKRQAVCNSMREREKSTRKNQSNEENPIIENGNIKTYTQKSSSRRKQNKSKLIMKYLGNKIDDQEENVDISKLHNIHNNIQKQESSHYLINNSLDSFQPIDELIKLNDEVIQPVEAQPIFEQIVEETSLPSSEQEAITYEEIENNVSMQVTLQPKEIDIKNIVKIENSKSFEMDTTNEKTEVQICIKNEIINTPLEYNEEVKADSIEFDSGLVTIANIEDIIGAQVSSPNTSPSPMQETKDVINSDTATSTSPETKSEEDSILETGNKEILESDKNQFNLLKVHVDNRLPVDASMHLEKVTAIEEIIGARKLLLSPKTSPSTSDSFEAKNKNLNSDLFLNIPAEMENTSKNQTPDFVGFQNHFRDGHEEMLSDTEDFQLNCNITENDAKKCKKLIFIDLNNLSKRIQDIKTKAKYLDTGINLQKNINSKQEIMDHDSNHPNTHRFNSICQNTNLLITAADISVPNDYSKEVIMSNNTMHIDIDVEEQCVSNITLDDVKNADNLVENIIFETSNFRKRHNFDIQINDVCEQSGTCIESFIDHNYSKSCSDVLPKKLKTCKAGYQEYHEVTECSNQDNCSNLLERANNFDKGVLQTVQQNTAEKCSVQKNEKLHSSQNLKKHMIKKMKTILKETIHQNQECEVNSLGNNASDKHEEVTLKDKAIPFVDANNFSCLPCNKHFSSLIFLLEHMSKHFNWYHYQCSKCSFMSYNRNTCVAHAVTYHINEFQEVESVVLPIPIWKTIALSNEFAPLYVTGRKNLQLDMLKSIEEKDPATTKNTDTSSNDETKLNTEEINLDIDPTVIKDCQQDPSVRKMIMEVIFGNDFTSKSSTLALKGESNCIDDSSRPVRIRTKSIKTSQKDFFYEKELQNLCKKNKKLTDSKLEVKPKKIISKSELKVYGKRRKITDSLDSKNDCLTVPPKHVVGDDPV